MKIKLNVTKDMKRELKQKAAEKEMERNELIYKIIDEFVQEKASVWESKVEGIMKNESEAEVSTESKAKAAMKKTTKKMQPIILNVEDKTYFALGIVAKKRKKSKEDMIVNILAEKIRA